MNIFKKKEVLLAVVLLLVIPFIYADYREVAFNDVLYEGDIIDINGKTLLFEFKSLGIFAISVTLPDDFTILVKLGDCDSHGQYTVCWDGIRKEEGSNRTDEDIHHWLDINTSREYTADDFTDEELNGLWKIAEDYTTIKETYRISARVFKLLPHVNITRKISKTRMISGQTTTIETEIKNDGSALAKNVRFTDYFPYPKFKFTGDFTECTWAGENMKWTGDLSINQRISCSYELKAFEQITFNSKPEAKYYDGFETRTDYGAETEFILNNQGISIDAQLSSEEVDVGDTITLNVNITNTDPDQDASLEFTIEPPLGIQIPKRVSTKMNWDGDNKLIYNEALGNGSSINFQLPLIAERAGSHNIMLRNIYKLGSFIGDEKINIPLDVTVPGFKITYDIATSVLLPKQKSTLVVNVENTNNFALNEVDVSVNSVLSSVGNSSKYIYELGAGSSQELFRFDIEAPDVDEETEFLITTKVNYKSINQYFDLEKQQVIKVVPKEEEVVSQTNETTEVQVEINETELVQEEIKEKKILKTTTLNIKKHLENKLFVFFDIILILGIIFLIFITIHTRKNIKK